MSRIVKFENVLLSEYVVVGQGNKHTLINVYSGDVVVQSFPARLMFAVYAEYKSLTTSPYSLLIQVKVDKKVHAKLRANVEPAGDGLVGILAIPGLDLTVDRDVVLEVTVTPDNERAVSLFRKRIFQGAVPISGAPSVAPPPP